MNCTGVRDRLPEHTLGVSGADAAALDRHLAWCAACRKEARDLQSAAASLAYALAPATPPEELEERVVEAVRSRVGAEPRRPRRGPTLLLVAAVALAGLGGGAVIARRQPADDPTLAAQRLDAEQTAFEEFVDAALAGEGTQALLGMLRRSDGETGGGSAVAVVSETADDQVMVVVSGLPAAAALPLRVELVDGTGRFITVGRVAALDGGGGFTAGLETPVDLTGFVNVLVRDHVGEVILSGTLRDRPVSSPSAAP